MADRMPGSALVGRHVKRGRYVHRVVWATLERRDYWLRTACGEWGYRWRDYTSSSAAVDCPGCQAHQ